MEEVDEKLLQAWVAYLREGGTTEHIRAAIFEFARADDSKDAVKMKARHDVIKAMAKEQIAQERGQQ